MPRQTEPNANNALGSLLQAMLPRSEVRSENTQAIAGLAVSCVSGIDILQG